MMISSVLALYIHWPFCLSKCPYCDFNSYVQKAVKEKEWAAAYCQEFQRLRILTGPRTLTSIFFGGGTPSLMSASLVKTLLEASQTHWKWSPTLEVTLEANPSSSQQHHFKELHQAGINRLSIGVQSFQETSLKFLGREHSAQEAHQTLSWAFDIFDRVSFDLIYALPNQTRPQWRQELQAAFSYPVTHLSLYQLTIEPGTAFGTRAARGENLQPPEQRSIDLYQDTQKMMEQAGLPAYEVSNHARPGYESQHNLAYWLYQDYIGVGPGAHTRLTLNNQEKVAIRHHRAPAVWLNSIQHQGHGEKERTPLTPQEQLEEALMMGLRLRQGIALKNLPAALPERAYEPLIQSGDLTLQEGFLSSTPQGRQRLNAVLKVLLT